MNNITVLICVHSNDVQHDDLLIEALYSLSEQTYKYFDVLLVLDECWDYTKSKISAYDFKLNMKIVEREKKEGLAFAKNFGLKMINTKWVAFLDGDDLYQPEKIEKQLKFLQEHNDIDFLGTLCWNRFLDRKDYSESCFTHGQYVTHEDIERRILNENVMTHGSLMIRKKCLEELNYYNHVKGMEDWDLWKRAIKKYKFHQLQERLYILTLGTSVVR